VLLGKDSRDELVPRGRQKITQDAIAGIPSFSEMNLARSGAAFVVEKLRAAWVAKNRRGSLGCARDRLFDYAPQALYHAINL
jgi:hypothetical protein